MENTTEKQEKRPIEPIFIAIPMALFTTIVACLTGLGWPLNFILGGCVIMIGFIYTIYLDCTKGEK